MAPYVPEYLKSQNRKLVFDLFLKQQVLSRAEIVQQTEMSFPTVSKAVDFLLSRSIIEETAGSTESHGPGRKRRLLKFNSSAYCALCLNFEGQYLDMGLIDLSGHLLCQQTMPFGVFLDREANSILATQMQAMLQKAPSPVLGIGIGLPANVDPATNNVVSFAYAGIGAPIEFCDLFLGMAEQFDLPLFVENDVNLACQGEVFCRGSTEELRNLCYLTLGTGFGAGIMLDGKLWRGAANRAGEIGHMLFQPAGGGSPCSLEDVIGLQAIDRRFGLHLLEDSTLTQAQKDAIIDSILEPLAASLYNVVYLFDLPHFILAGYLPNLLGQPLLDRLQTTVNQMLADSDRPVQLSRPCSSYNSLIGGASLVFEQTILNELMD